MKKSIPLLIVLLVFHVNHLFAQKGYFDGYIVTMRNDTVAGKVKDNETSTNSTTKVLFIDASGKKKTYLPKQLTGYSRKSKNDRVSYMVVTARNGKTFAKIEVDGDIRLLVININKFSSPNMGSNSSTQPQTPRNNMDGMATKEFYLYNVHSKKVTLVRNHNFKKQMTEYFSDCPELTEMISKKDMKILNLDTIVAKYNAWKREKASNL